MPRKERERGDKFEISFNGYAKVGDLPFIPPENPLQLAKMIRGRSSWPKS
jgi:hypothetical protein